VFCKTLGALVLCCMAAVPFELLETTPASATPPSTTIVLPSHEATLSGTVYLDATASIASSVEFRLLGGIHGFSGPVMCNARLTIVGWLCAWNTSTVPNGSYVVVSEALNPTGSAFSSGVTVTVENPATTSTTIVLPTHAATLSGTVYLDATAPIASSLEFRLFGGIYGFSGPVMCNARLTIVGWLCAWNTSTVPNGSYVVVSEALNPTGSAFSSGVTVTVENPATTTAVPSGGLSAPAGYTSQQLIFDDQFSGTSLDATKWNTYLGAQGSAWDNNGSLPAPYSGPNVPGAGTDLEMFGPSQVGVDNGLTLTAQRNTNPYSGAYPWISGVVTTEGKFSLPTTGWYVQARIKVPDMTQGLWPSMWFLPAGPGPSNEIDFVQGGFYGGPGNVDDAPVGAGYFDSAGNNVNEAVPDVGFDASAGYHTYGIQWTPGVGIDEYVDGNLVWTVTESEVPGGIVAQAYEIILDLQVAANADAGWRTVTTATSPGGSMDVAEVQAYS
jgi:beta-glucanase (GH16 family)